MHAAAEALKQLSYQTTLARVAGALRIQLLTVARHCTSKLA